MDEIRPPQEDMDVREEKQWIKDYAPSYAN